jgi:hypothetical protein
MKNPNLTRRSYVCHYLPRECDKSGRPRTVQLVTASAKERASSSKRPCCYLNFPRSSLRGNGRIVCAFSGIDCPWNRSELCAVTNAILRKPSSNDWLMQRHDCRATSYSPLDQINADNVKTLKLAWMWPMHEDGTNQPATSSTTEPCISPIRVASSRHSRREPES